MNAGTGGGVDHVGGGSAPGEAPSPDPESHRDLAHGVPARGGCTNDQVLELHPVVDEPGDGGKSGRHRAVALAGGFRRRSSGLADPDAREIIYGMPYKEWQARHQTEANAEQKAAFAKTHQGH